MSNEHVHPIFQGILKAIAPEVPDDYNCRVCGVECPISDPVNGAVCEAHCPDHDYIYERGEGHRCKHCFAPPPADWYNED